MSYLKTDFCPIPPDVSIHNHSCENHHQLDSELLFSYNGLHIQEVMPSIPGLEARVIPPQFNKCQKNQ
jgi:hypothetical protein